MRDPCLGLNFPIAFIDNITFHPVPEPSALALLGFGKKPPDPKCANMRAYMWSRMREWLIEGGAIEDDAELETDLTSPEYAHNRQDRLVLESKELMKHRGQEVEFQLNWSLE